MRLALKLNCHLVANAERADVGFKKGVHFLAAASVKARPNFREDLIVGPNLCVLAFGVRCGAVGELANVHIFFPKIIFLKVGDCYVDLLEFVDCLVAHFDFAFVVVVVVTVKHWRHDSARGLCSQQVFLTFSFGDCMRGLKKFIFFRGRAPTLLSSGIYRVLSL